MAERTLEVVVHTKDIYEQIHRLVQQTRRDERACVIRLLHSNHGRQVISAGGLATPLLLERLTALIEGDADEVGES